MCKQIDAAFSYEERRATQAIDCIGKEALACSKANEELQAAAIASDDMLEATLSELGAVRKQLNQYKRLTTELRTALEIANAYVERFYKA